MEIEVMTRSKLSAEIRASKQKRDDLLKQYIVAHPELSYPAIGELFELLPTHVATIAHRLGVTRKRGKKVKTTNSK